MALPSNLFDWDWYTERPYFIEFSKCPNCKVIRLVYVFNDFDFDFEESEMPEDGAIVQAKFCLHCNSSESIRNLILTIDEGDN